MTPPPQATVALLSGGLDSAIALQLGIRQGWQIALALTFDYGQRSAPREIRQAAALCAHFGVPHKALELAWFRDWASTSALLDRGRDLPRPQASELDRPAAARATAKAVWVPNRNGIFIEIAAGYAESLGAKAVLVGFNREEAQTFADNSQAYQEAVSRALAFSTANGVEVISPTAPLDKKAIVRAGIESGFPFRLLWSCYENGERMCGVCESCRRLKRALGANGVESDDLFADPS
jgi:7-cyano-7-deazaguanine synthase